MKNIGNKFKSVIGITLFLFVFVSMGPGCAGTRKTTTTETTVSTSGDQRDQRVVGAVEQSETTTTTTTETEPKDRGIIGATVHTIGYVIALPFKIVGSVLRMLFGG